jgi:ribosomal protein S18 acetylase RimI-like enzyme
MTIRPVAADDGAGLDAFFRRIPEGERAFIKEDLLDAAVLESILRGGNGQRQVAVDGDEVIGYVAVLPGLGWTSHVGELRLVVDAAHRGKGLGRQLARAALVGALDMGLAKVFVEVVADQSNTVAMFQGLGFEPEALLRDHARDRTGELRDLIMLAHRVDENWATMTTLGVDEEVGAPS